MSCFSWKNNCFAAKAEAAATTIGKYYRGNAARGTYKKRDAAKILATSIQRVTWMGAVKSRMIKVSDDEKALRYSKPSAPTPKDLPFASIAKISLASTDITIALKTGQTYTLRSETKEVAEARYYALSLYVDAKVMASKPVVPKEAKEPIQ